MKDKTKKKPDGKKDTVKINPNETDTAPTVVESSNLEFGLEHGPNAKKVSAVLKKHGIPHKTSMTGGIHYFHFDKEHHGRLALRRAREVIDHSKESGWQNEELSAPEVLRRDRFLEEMRSRLPEFIEKYGKNGPAVLYSTAERLAETSWDILPEDLFEGEILAELSKKTLGSYIKKAESGQFELGRRYGESLHEPKDRSEYRRKQYEKGFKRHKGIQMAVDKLTKEEYVKPVGAPAMGKRPQDKEEGEKKVILQGSSQVCDHGKKPVTKEEYEAIKESITRKLEGSNSFFRAIYRKELDSIDEKYVVVEDAGEDLTDLSHSHKYAQRRADETGRRYMVSTRGKAMADVPANRRMLRSINDEPVAIYSPRRKR